MMIDRATKACSAGLACEEGWDSCWRAQRGACDIDIRGKVLVAPAGLLMVRPCHEASGNGVT